MRAKVARKKFNGDEEDVNDEEDDLEAEDEHYKLFIWLDDYVQSLTDNVYSNDDIR